MKLTLYARAGIPEVWIIDLEHRVLEVYVQPGPNGYAATRTHQPGDTVALALAPEIAVALRRVFD